MSLCQFRVSTRDIYTFFIVDRPHFERWRGTVPQRHCSVSALPPLFASNLSTQLDLTHSARAIHRSAPIPQPSTVDEERKNNSGTQYSIAMFTALFYVSIVHCPTSKFHSPTSLPAPPFLNLPKNPSSPMQSSLLSFSLLSASFIGP